MNSQQAWQRPSFDFLIGGSIASDLRLHAESLRTSDRAVRIDLHGSETTLRYGGPPISPGSKRFARSKADIFAGQAFATRQSHGGGMINTANSLRDLGHSALTIPAERIPANLCITADDAPDRIILKSPARRVFAEEEVDQFLEEARSRHIDAIIVNSLPFPEIADLLLREGTRRNMPIYATPSPAVPREKTLARLIPAAHLLACNLSEFVHLAAPRQTFNEETCNPELLANIIRSFSRSLPAPVSMVVSLGAQGFVAHDTANDVTAHGHLRTSALAKVKCAREQFPETKTGAGDRFLAALCAADLPNRMSAPNLLAAAVEATATVANSFGRDLGITAGDVTRTVNERSGRRHRVAA